MYSSSNSQSLNKSLRVRQQRRKKKLNRLGKRSLKTNQSESTSSSSSDLNTRMRDILVDLCRPGSRFSSYTSLELEPICQQIALQEMASLPSSSSVFCPLICQFCEHFIYEPVTLYCGHTFCEACIRQGELLQANCPRCPPDIQGQIQSPILVAQQGHYTKNHFLKNLFERSETLQSKCRSLQICYEAQKEFALDNYEAAIRIYSEIFKTAGNFDNHLALHGRAKAYAALKQFDEALADADRVVALKPQWPKGYYCRSEILFEMKDFTKALLSSLQALALNPEDQHGKEIMARHLHAVLHDDDNKEASTGTTSEPKQTDAVTSSVDGVNKTGTTDSSAIPLTMCKSTQTNNGSRSCLCTEFDYKCLQIRDFECSICVNLMWFPVTTPCGHVVCRECLIRSVDNTLAQCPICKSSLEEFFPLLIQSHVNKTDVIAQMIETYFSTEFSERRQQHEQENARSSSILQMSSGDNDQTAAAAAVILEIPIFICVLTLPNCVCPLHVFEPRYRLMMRRTIETESRTFGMCQYDHDTRNFADYGTLLFIRGLVYTQDGRSVVDTIGQRRFRVLERGTRDGYSTARVELIRDQSIEQHEYEDLCALNHDTYNRVRTWFDNLDAYRRTLISYQLEGYPPCDELERGSEDGPTWAWIMLNILPIEPLLQYTALASQSFRVRLQMLNDTIDFLLNQQQEPTTTTTTTTPSTTAADENEQ